MSQWLPFSVHSVLVQEDIGGLDWWTITKAIIGVLGGLALFLFGIEKMSDGLRAVAGERLKFALGKLTANRLNGMLTGATFTAMVQSSSLTTVLVVSFVSAGLMSLQQSVAVIIGSNIGTTLTAQLAAFKVTSTAWLLVGIGFGLHSLYKRDWTRYLGSVLLGLGLLFLAIEQMSASTAPMRDSTLFLGWMQQLEHPFLGIFVGAMFTAIVQSSSASTGVVIALASQNLLQLPAALAIILGSNLGSCITAMLAAIGKPVEARQAAVVHLLFNVIGVLAWCLFLPQLALMAQWTSGELPRQIANAHAIFNVSTALTLIWFSGSIATAAQRVVRYRPGESEPFPALSTPIYLDETLLETPALALDRLRREIGHLGDCVVASLNRSWTFVFRGSKEELQAVSATDIPINHLHLATINYARRLGRRELSHKQSNELSDCTTAANYLENVGDIVVSGIIHQGLRRIENSLTVSPNTESMIHELHVLTVQSLEKAILAFQEADPVQADQVLASKSDYQALSRSVVDRLRVELIVDRVVEPILFQFEIDLIGQYDRIHYLSRQIAKLASSKSINVASQSEIPTNDEETPTRSDQADS